MVEFLIGLVVGYLIGFTAVWYIWRWRVRRRMVARGSALDALGRCFGLDRCKRESDRKYRRRILDHVRQIR